ncbi:N-acetyl-gamma-glutamyl-phosphate reductase [Striga asiatica]|uniref:N-acetyl-gamma-glutamyl-phosphate reductase n=1 Tax=Striga asiatica TaxID=4170 RepID=A0A5A7Q047_STRAF|nr:N-acetyl-gamma-glutamyl-phosphate reductase [Striga asiatica]
MAKKEGYDIWRSPDLCRQGARRLWRSAVDGNRRRKVLDSYCEEAIVCESQIMGNTPQTKKRAIAAPSFLYPTSAILPQVPTSSLFRRRTISGFSAVVEEKPASSCSPTR